MEREYIAKSLGKRFAEANKPEKNEKSFSGMTPISSLQI
jgi:hypothetical protein